MKKIIVAGIIAVFCAVSAFGQTILEQWNFNTEANGTSFSNLVNSGTAGAAKFGEDHLGTYVTNGALRFTSASTGDCFRVAEMTTSGLKSGVYELSWTYPHAEINSNNSTFGLYLRSKETYTPSDPTKATTDMFQFRLMNVSGALTVQTRVTRPNGNAGIVNHFALPSTNVSDVQVKLTVDLNNHVLNGKVVYGGTTNTFSRLFLNLPADYIRVHGTSTSLLGSEYVEIDNVQWSFLEEGAVKNVAYTEYLFNTETNGTHLGKCVQTGVDPSGWSAATIANGVSADGAGNLRFINAISNSFKTFSFVVPLTNQVVELEYKLPSWDLTGFSNAEGNNIAFELRNFRIGATNSIKISMDRSTNDLARINWIKADSTGPRQTLDALTGSNLTVKLQINLAAGTFAAFYNQGSGWITKATGQSLGDITQLDEVRLVVDGVAAWGAGSYVKVDYFKVSLVAPKKLIDYQFDDALNTDLKELWNGGSITNNWDFNKTGEVFAAGSGKLLLTNLTSGTRKLSFTNAPLTNAVITLDWRVNAWNLQALGASEGFSIAMGDTIGAQTVKSKFFTSTNAADVRMTMTDASSQGKQKDGFDVTNGTDGVTFRLVNNLDIATFHGYYKMDSATNWTEITITNTVGLSRIDEIVLVADTWTGSGFTEVDYMTMSAGPAVYDLTVNDGAGGGSYTNGQQVAITASNLFAKTFVAWTGDTAYVTDSNSPSTTVTMPAQSIVLTATYVDTTYALTVTSGSGGGSYTNAEVVTITANAPPGGQVFDAWTGDTGVLASNTASTTFSMPAQAVTLTATYKDITYVLSVNSGGGDGSYTNGAVVPITADPPDIGLVFLQWTGSGAAYVANVFATNTTVTMPASNITVNATYGSAAVELKGLGSTGGSVTPASASVAINGSQAFTITASNLYRIATVKTNNVNVVGLTFNNTSTSYVYTWTNVQMTGTVSATFTAQVTTNPAASGANVPYSWLAGYGLTNYEADSVLDQDNDGMKTWQEYVANTVPTNAASVLKAAQASRNVISWTAQPGRLYSVHWSTNLVKGFSNLNNNATSPFTNTAPDARVNHYQIKVRLP